MNLRNAIRTIFGRVTSLRTGTWREIGNHTSIFSIFGTDIYANETVRSCIRTLAEHTSKANIKVVRHMPDGIIPGDVKLQRMIQSQPNMYMNGKDFLYKVRTMFEINNIAFIYIMRDDKLNTVGLYPMPRANYEALDYNGELFIKFQFNNSNTMVLPFKDLAVLRKDYNTSDIFSDSNDAILTSLQLLTTTNEGMANAIKSTANLRGILKSTKAMLSEEDVRKTKDRFVSDYMSLENTSGVASLDSTQDFTPLELKPALANYKSVEELRLNIYRYFGMNEEVLTSQATGDKWQAFYEGKIEGFLLALGLELTNKIYSDRQRGFGNEVLFESNRISYLSIQDKLNLVQLVDRGALTPNEWREALNLAPIEGGDKPIRRLDTAPVSDVAQSQKEDSNADSQN